MTNWSLIWTVILSSGLFGDHDVSAVHANSLSLSSTYHIVDKKPLCVVSDRFLSYTLEPGELIHVADCGEANDTSNLIRTLLPAYLRIAGPDSKKLMFQNQHLDEPTNVTSGDHKNRKLDNILVTGPQWLKFIEFVKNKTGLQIIVSLNGNFERDHSDLDLTNALEFITFSSKNNLDLDWELGYEFQKMSDHDSRILGRDVTKLRKVLDVFPRYRKSLILGPDMTSFETRGDVAFIQSYLSEAGDSLDAFTLHYDFSNLKEDDDIFGNLSPIFNRMDTYLWIKDGILKTLAKGVVDRKSIWLSESESKGQYCSFAETLSFVQRLGAAAKLGVSVYLRKPNLMSLSVPTSEYWAAVLFKSLVGKIVLDAKYVDGNNTNVFAFGHCTRVLSSSNDSIINPYVAYKPGAITLYGVNTGSEWSRFFFKLNSKYEQVAHLYILTEDRDSYKEKTLFNRQELRLSDDNELPIVFPRIREYVKYVMLPPKSIFFIVLPYASSRACMTNLPNADESQYVGKKKSLFANDSSVVDLVGILEEDDFDDGAIYVSYASKKQESSTSPSPDAPKAAQSTKTKFITYSEDTWLSPLPNQLKEIFYRGPVRMRDDAGVLQPTSRSKKEKRLTKIENYRVITQALLGKRNVSQNISQDSRYSRSMDTHAHDSEVEGRGERDEVDETEVVEESMLDRDPTRVKEDIVTTTPPTSPSERERLTKIENYAIITQALLGKRNVSQNVSEEPFSRHARSIDAYAKDQEVEDEEEERGEIDKIVTVEGGLFDSNQARMKRQNYLTQALMDVSQSISKVFSRPSRSVDAYAEDQVLEGRDEIHKTVSVVGGLFDGDDNTKTGATNNEQEPNTRALIHLRKRRDADRNDSHSVMTKTSSFPSEVENLSNSAKAALLLDVDEGDRNVRPSREISSDTFDTVNEDLSTRLQRIVPLTRKLKKGKHPDEVVLSYPTHQHKTTASASVMSNPPSSDENQTPVSMQMHESTTSTTPVALLDLRSDEVNESSILASDETSEHVSKVMTTSVAETMSVGGVPEGGRSSMDEERTAARKKSELAPTPNPHKKPEKIPIISPIKRKPGYMSTQAPTTSTSKQRRRNRFTKPTSPEPSTSPSPVPSSTKRSRRTTTSRPTTSTTSASYSTRRRGGRTIFDHRIRPTDTLPKQIETAHEKVKRIIDANRAKIQTLKDERMQRKSQHPAVRLKREVAQPNLHEMKTLPIPHHAHLNKLASDESSHEKVRGLTNDAINKAKDVSSDVSESVREKIRSLTNWIREKYNEIKKDLVSTRSMQDVAQVRKQIREYSAKLQKELASLRESLRSRPQVKTSSRRKSMQPVNVNDGESSIRPGQHQRQHHAKIIPKSAKSAETYEDQEFVTPPITTMQAAGQIDQDNLTSDLLVSRSVRSIESNEISSENDDVPPPSADGANDRNETPGLDHFEANMVDTKLRKVASQFPHPIKTPLTSRVEDEWFGGAATKKVHRHDSKRDDPSTKTTETPSDNVVDIDEVCDRKASLLSYVWCKCKNFVYVVLAVLNDGQHD